MSSSANEYHTAEGSARKRQKTSRHGGRPVNMAPACKAVDKAATTNKHTPASAGVPNGIHTDGTPCHHEQGILKLNQDLEAMRQLITCKICQHFLYEPYALSCGHTFCYSCLTQWMGDNRKKTCPDCRSNIRDQPTPSYLIRELVLVFISRSELLPDGETAEEHANLAKEEADVVAKDKANTDPRRGGLFKGSFRSRGIAGRPLIAIRDDSDHVDRCPQCMHEVEDGYCHTCNVRVRTESDDEDSMYDSESEGSGADSLIDDELDDELDALDADGFGDFDEDDLRVEDPALHPFGAYGLSGRDFIWGEASEISDGDEVDWVTDDNLNSEHDGDDESESEDDYDEDGVSDDPEAPPVNSQPRRRNAHPIVLSDDDEDADSSVRQLSEDPTSAGARRDLDDDSGEETSRQSSRRLDRRPRLPSSDEDDSENEHGSGASPPTSGGFSPLQQDGNGGIQSSVDGTDSDDEHEHDMYAHDRLSEPLTTTTMHTSDEEDESDAFDRPHMTGPQLRHRHTAMPFAPPEQQTSRESARPRNPRLFGAPSPDYLNNRYVRPAHPFQLSITLDRINGVESQSSHRNRPSGAVHPSQRQLAPRSNFSRLVDDSNEAFSRRNVGLVPGRYDRSPAFMDRSRNAFAEEYHAGPARRLPHGARHLPAGGVSLNSQESGSSGSSRTVRPDDVLDAGSRPRKRNIRTIVDDSD